MSFVDIEGQGDVAVVRMSRGVTNAINGELLEELCAAWKEIREGYRGMVLAGGEKFFSIGLDLSALVALERPALEGYWKALNAMCLELFTLPLPTAAAIKGHATAGGTILALMCDFRLLGEGRKLMGLNEVQLGLPVPYLADLVLRQVAGDRSATELTYSGKLVPPEKARDLGIADAVLPPEEVEAAAISEVTSLAAASVPAFRAIKSIRTEAVLEAFARNEAARSKEFIDTWFLDETRPFLIAAAKKMSR